MSALPEFWTNLALDDAVVALGLGDWLVSGCGVELFVDEELLVVVMGREDRLRLWVVDLEDYEAWLERGRRGPAPGQELCLMGRASTQRVCSALRRLCPALPAE